MSPADFVPGAPSRRPTPPPPTPTRGRSATRRSIPTSPQLLDIGGARAGVFWPATGTAGAGRRRDARRAAPSTTSTSLTLVPSTRRPRGRDRRDRGRHAASPARPTVLVYDTDVSRELHEASLTEETALRGAPLTAATAYLAFAVAETDGAPARWSPSTATSDRVAGRPAHRDHDRHRRRPASPRSPSAARDSSGPPTVEIADAAADDGARGRGIRPRSPTRAALSRFATILDDPSPDHRTRARRDPAAARASPGCPTRRRGRPRSPRTAPRRRRRSTRVGILPPSPIKLFSAGAPIPVWVRNDLPYPVNVVLYATPDDLRLDVQPATAVIAGAAEQHARRGAGPGADRQRRGDARRCSCAAARASPIGDAAGRRGQRARRLGGRRHRRRSSIARRRAARARRRAHRAALRRGARARPRREPTRRGSGASSGADRPPTRPTRSAAMSGIGTRERPDRRRHDRLAPHRVPARRRAGLGRRRDDRRRRRLRDRQPAAEQHLRDHLDRPAHRGRSSRRSSRRPRTTTAAGRSSRSSSRSAPWCSSSRRRSRRSPRRGSCSSTRPASRPTSRRSRPRSRTGACRRSSSTASTRSSARSLNARRVFGPFTWAPIVNNVVSIAGLPGVHPCSSARAAPSTRLDARDDRAARRAPRLSASSCRRSSCSCFWRRTGLHVRPDFRWRGVGLNQLGRLAGLDVPDGGRRPARRARAVARALAMPPRTTPAILVSQNAWLLFMLPYSIIVLSIGTPYFTQLSEHAAAGRDDDVRGDIGRSIRTLGLFIVIATAALAVAAVPASRIFTDSRDEAVAAARRAAVLPREPRAARRCCSSSSARSTPTTTRARRSSSLSCSAPSWSSTALLAASTLPVELPRGRRRARPVVREHRAGDRRDVAAAAASRRAPGRVLDAVARPIRPRRRPGCRRRAGSRSCCSAESTAGPSRTSCSAPSAAAIIGIVVARGVRRRSSRCCAHPSSAPPWRSRDGLLPGRR